jgi:hypothetical protein
MAPHGFSPMYRRAISKARTRLGFCFTPHSGNRFNARHLFCQLAKSEKRRKSGFRDTGDGKVITVEPWGVHPMGTIRDCDSLVKLL